MLQISRSASITEHPLWLVADLCQPEQFLCSFKELWNKDLAVFAGKEFVIGFIFVKDCIGAFIVLASEVRFVGFIMQNAHVKAVCTSTLFLFVGLKKSHLLHLYPFYLP